MDITYKKLQGNWYQAVYLDGKLIGRIFKMKRYWSVTPEIPYMLVSPIHGFCSKYKAVDYLLEAQEAYKKKGDFGPAAATCPCKLVEPCKDTCTCANPIMSGGCERCASYGNIEQRTNAAQRLALLPKDVEWYASLLHKETVYHAKTREELYNLKDQKSPLLEGCKNQLEEALEVIKDLAGPDFGMEDAKDFCERWGIDYD